MPIIDLVGIITEKLWTMWGRDGADQVDVISVSSSIHVFDLRYGEIVRSESDVPLEGAQGNYLNNSDAQDTQSFQDSRVTSATWTWSVTQGVSRQTSINIGVQTPVGINVGSSMSTTISVSTTEGQSISKSQTWGWSTNIPIPPRSRIIATVDVHTLDIECPFTAIADFYGDIIFHVRLPQYSNPDLRIQYPIGKFFDKHGHPPGIQVIGPGQIRVDIAGVHRSSQGLSYRVVVNQYPASEAATAELKASWVRVQEFLTFSDDPPTIGPPDGTHYTVIGVRYETRPSVACGFNDAGAPNMGRYRIETRSYEEYRNGQLVRSWTEDSETFDDCVPA